MNFVLKTHRFNYKKLFNILLNVGGFGDMKIYIRYISINRKNNIIFLFIINNDIGKLDYQSNVKFNYAVSFKILKKESFL